MATAEWYMAVLMVMVNVNVNVDLRTVFHVVGDVECDGSREW